MDLPVTMLWRCVIPTLGYPPLLHNTGTCLSLARQRFSDFSTLAPHLLVTWFSSVRHNLVVYASTVNILSLMVFCDGNSALLFIRTLVWEGESFVLYNPNQMWVQCFFSFSVFCYIVVFFGYTYDVVGMLFALVFFSKVVNYQGEKCLRHLCLHNPRVSFLYISIFWSSLF